MFKILLISAIIYLAVAKPSNKLLEDKDELKTFFKSLKEPITETLRLETDEGNVYELEIGANMTYFHLTAQLTEATTPEPVKTD